MTGQLNLRAAEPQLIDQAREAFEEGDSCGFVGCALSQDRLLLVADNVVPLKARGIYEPCLLTAFVATRVSNWEWPETALDFLFRSADRAKLRAAGKSLPGEGPFRIYRGVAGTGPARRPRGYSWTDSPDGACWFATRWRLPDPEVLSAVVQDDEILAYYNGRHEREFVTKPARFTRCEIAVDEMRKRAARWFCTTRPRNRRAATIRTRRRIAGRARPRRRRGSELG